MDNAVSDLVDLMMDAVHAKHPTLAGETLAQAACEILAYVSDMSGTSRINMAKRIAARLLEIPTVPRELVLADLARPAS